jgi:crossover junction endodeoxyribonuclease RuvC
MIILGIDPGLAYTGYGIIHMKGRKFALIDSGVISTPSTQETGKRLDTIFSEVQTLIDSNKPEQAGVESLYFAKNALSAIPVAQARGVVLLALAQRSIPTAEYPPQAIKQAIVGNGRADKEQVQELVRILLGLKDIPKPDHAADALAAAICHYNTLESPTIT